MTYLLLDPTTDAPLRDFSLDTLEALCTSLLGISIAAHLPQSAITPVADWDPDRLLAQIAGCRLTFSTEVSARQRLIEENAPAEPVEKLESDLTDTDRATLRQVPYQMIPAADGQFLYRFSAPQSHAAPVAQTADEQMLLTLLDQFESFVAEGKQRGALLRNLAVEMPTEPAPAPQA